MPHAIKEEAKSAPERQGQPWNEKEERALYDAFLEGKGVEAIAQRHGRTAGGIRSHLRRLGLLDSDNVKIQPAPPFAITPAVGKRLEREATRAAKAAERKQAVAAEDADPAPEMNARFREALGVMEDSTHSAFITGKAGSGKSTLLRWFARHTNKRAVVLAPTGVAALNAGGQTIHNFFRFTIDITPQKVRAKKKPRNAQLYKKLQTLVIDEVSMVRAVLLDCVDAFLRLHGPAPGAPFGGVQMIFIGDLYQLPPVVTSQEAAIFRDHYASPYFFSANALKDFPLAMIELEKIYRQKDADFVALLNRVRNNSVTAADIERLNSRLHAPVAAPDKTGAFAISLTATNARADEINHAHLVALKARMQRSLAEIEGDFGREYYPTATELSFKIGAQVMMLNNDPEGRWVNGSLGVIEDVAHDEEDEEFLSIRLQDAKEPVDVYRHTWEVYKFALAENQIVSEPAGRFTQYPFRLAWAVTIHKSQGKTFSRVTIDVGAGTFAAGQMYVALSRCTAFEGITLRTPLKPQHIRTDPRIYGFLTGYQYRAAEAALPREDKAAIIRHAIREKAPLEIVYLKGNDEKTTRTVRPRSLGEETYKDKKFTGMKAWCDLRKEERVFSLDRILEIRQA